MKRTVLKDVLNHCYERTADRGVLFYKVSDHLLYFTVFCTTARKYKVRVLKLVQMPDHLHQGIVEERKGELSAFIRECTSTFSREYNKAVGRKGPLLDTPFGKIMRKTVAMPNFQVMLQKFDQSCESEIVNLNSITVVGRCVRLEAEL